MSSASSERAGAAGSGSSLTLERFLPYRLNVLASLTSQALAQIYADRFGLTIPGWRVVATLGQYRVSTARDIAAHGAMHKSTVSRAVSDLETRGLVRRQSNRHDRREELLALTPGGQAVYDTVVPEALAFEAQLVSVLTSQEQGTLAAILDKLESHARRMVPHREGTP